MVDALEWSGVEWSALGGFRSEERGGDGGD